MKIDKVSQFLFIENIMMVPSAATVTATAHTPQHTHTHTRTRAFREVLGQRLTMFGDTIRN